MTTFSPREISMAVILLARVAEKNYFSDADLSPEAKSVLYKAQAHCISDGRGRIESPPLRISR